MSDNGTAGPLPDAGPPARLRPAGGHRHRPHRRPTGTPSAPDVDAGRRHRHRHRHRHEPGWTPPAERPHRTAAEPVGRRRRDLGRHDHPADHRAAHLASHGRRDGRTDQSAGGVHPDGLPLPPEPAHRPARRGDHQRRGRTGLPTGAVSSHPRTPAAPSSPWTPSAGSTRGVAPPNGSRGSSQASSSAATRHCSTPRLPGWPGNHTAP